MNRELNKFLAFCNLVDPNLEDLRENIEAPIEQLNRSGELQIRFLQRYNISTQEDLDKIIFNKDTMGLIEKTSKELEEKLLTLLFW